MPERTTGHFTFTKWEEQAVSPSDAGPKLARASVVNAFTGGIESAATTCEYTLVYVTEKTGTFTGMQLFTGTLDGREGAFVIEERGTFDADGTVRCAFEVVPGSGTGGLTHLKGTGDFIAKHGEQSVSYTFHYDLG